MGFRCGKKNAQTMSSASFMGIEGIEDEQRFRDNAQRSLRDSALGKAPGYDRQKHACMIVDKDASAREEIACMLAVHRDIRLVAQAVGVDDARRMLLKKPVNLLFLDTDLRGGSGFDLMPDIHPVTRIIFVTADVRHAVRAFEVNALDYLTKPVTAARLAIALQRFREHIRFRPLFCDKCDASDPGVPHRTHDEKILVASDKGQRFVKLMDIVAITSIGGNYTALSVNELDQELTVRTTFKEWQHLLPPSVFFRIHRGAIINLNFIREIERNNHTFLVHLEKHDNPLSVSRRVLPFFKRQLHIYS